MKAVIYEAFNAPQQLKQVADPNPETRGVVVKVMATGVCRRDWPGWGGHDAKSKKKFCFLLLAFTLPAFITAQPIPSRAGTLRVSQSAARESVFETPAPLPDSNLSDQASRYRG